MGITREEQELRLALRGTASVAAREARREAREELDMRLALEESGNDYWWSQMPPQLCWLRRPDSLQQLLQRPLWMDAWRRGEEERAVLLWAKLPDNIMNTILDLLEQQRLAAKASRLPRKWARSFRAYERGRRRGSLEPGLAVCGRERAPSNWFCQLACVYVCARCRSCINVVSQEWCTYIHHSHTRAA